MTPEAAVVLSDLRRHGVVDICEQCEVLDATWDWSQQRWDVWMQVRVCEPGNREGEEGGVSSVSLEVVDATGAGASSAGTCGRR